MSQTIQNCKEGKYINDTVFQQINSNFLTLQEDDIKIYKYHLDNVVEETLLPLMERNKLFNVIFDKLICGGSYNKGTKYGKPEEFDLHLVVKLPVDYDKIRVEINPDDYCYVKLIIPRNSQEYDWMQYSHVLNTWLNKRNYLDQNKFRDWMQSVFMSALSYFPKKPHGYVIPTQTASYVVNYTFCGPAFTLKIKTGNISISVDIVACLEVTDVTLGNGYRPLIYGNKQVWQVVPKPVSSKVPNNQLLWRLCFQHQEKELLIGDIKQIIRMMKKMRDSRKWNSLVSYYIETIFYHELAKYKTNVYDYIKNSRTTLFMLGLDKLKQAFANQKLAYFWHKESNLFDSVEQKDLRNFSDQLHRIITIIDKNIEKDPFILADMVLENHEAHSLRKVNGCVNKQKRNYISDLSCYNKKNRFRRYRKKSDPINSFVLFYIFAIIVYFIMFKE